MIKYKTDLWREERTVRIAQNYSTRTVRIAQTLQYSYSTYCTDLQYESQTYDTHTHFKIKYGFTLQTVVFCTLVLAN